MSDNKRLLNIYLAYVVDGWFPSWMLLRWSREGYWIGYWDEKCLKESEKVVKVFPLPDPGRVCESEEMTILEGEDPEGL